MTAAQDRIRRANALDAQRNAPAIARTRAASLLAAASTIAAAGVDRSPDPAALFRSLRLVSQSPVGVALLVPQAAPTAGGAS